MSNDDKTRIEKEMGIDVTLCLSPTAEELLTNVSMHLESIAFSLKVLRDVADGPGYVHGLKCEECIHKGHLENCPSCGPPDWKNRETHEDVEGVPVFDEASDDARDPTMEPCPNCGEIKVHESHDPGHDPVDWFECEACHHSWSEAPDQGVQEGREGP